MYLIQNTSLYTFLYLFLLILVGHQCDYVNGDIINQLKFHPYPIYLPLPTLQIHMGKVHWHMIFFGHEANLF